MMAKEAGISASSVQRIWRAHGLQPHRVRQFKLSNDPNFVEKLHDVVGLYVNPPEHAIVLSVDEKSQIQALDRTQPGLPLKKGRAATMTHDYKRNGTTTLFAAFDVLEGKVIGRCMQKHRHQEFIRFLNQIEAQVPAKKAVHVILDNYATHKHPKVRKWLAIRGSRSISRPPRHRGSMPSKASLPNSPNGASNAASSARFVNSRPPSTDSSTKPTMTPSPSLGPQIQTKSSPPSNEGTNC
jgi:DDE superfamily endonuclease